MKADYQTITDKIITDLENGVASWCKPWDSRKAGMDVSTGLPYNASSKRNYSGVNIVTLWSAATAFGYGHAGWLTFKQANDLGGRVRKGEKGTQVVYVGKWTKTVTDSNGDESERAIPILKAYYVFNVSQIDGLPESLYETPKELPEPILIENAESFIKALGSDIRFGGDRAFYTTAGDYIQMPPIAAFKGIHHYYSTMLHEHGHWTGHNSRLSRDLFNRFGDEAYAFEELVAELTAAFMCAHLGIEGRLQHSEYIQSWIKVLKGDKRAYFKAASLASKAADYLCDLAASAEPVDCPDSVDEPVIEPVSDPVPVTPVPVPVAAKGKPRMRKIGGIKIQPKWHWSKFYENHVRAQERALSHKEFNQSHMARELATYYAKAEHQPLADSIGDHGKVFQAHGVTVRQPMAIAA